MTPKEKANEMLEIMTKTGAKYFCKEMLNTLKFTGYEGTDLYEYWIHVFYEVGWS